MLGGSTIHHLEDVLLGSPGSFSQLITEFPGVRGLGEQVQGRRLQSHQGLDQTSSVTLSE